MKKLVLLLSVISPSIFAAQKPAPQAEVKREVGAAEKIANFETKHVDLAGQMYRFIANWLDKIKGKPTSDDRKKLYDLFVKKYRLQLEIEDAPSAQTLINHFLEQARVQKQLTKLPRSLAAVPQKAKVGISQFYANLGAVVPLWNVVKKVQVLPEGGDSFSYLGISNDGSVVVYAYKDQLHTVANNQRIWTYQQVDFFSLALSRKGNRVVGGTWQGTRDESECIDGTWSNPNYKRVGEGVVFVAVSDDGNVLASVEHHGELLIETLGAEQRINLGHRTILSMAMSGDATVIALGYIGAPDCCVDVVTREKGRWKLSEKPIMTFPAPEGIILRDVAINGTGTRIAVKLANAVVIAEKKGDRWHLSDSPIMNPIQEEKRVGIKKNDLLMSDDGSVVVARSEVGTSVQVARIQPNGQWNVQYLTRGNQRTLTAMNAAGDLIVTLTQNRMLINYWDGKKYEGCFLEPSNYFKYLNFGVVHPSYKEPQVAMSADGTTIAMVVLEDVIDQNVSIVPMLYVLENPAFKYGSELSADHLQFLQDLVRIGTKSIIRLNQEQFSILESMPWPVIQAVIATYLIAWEPNPKEKMSKHQFEAEKIRLNGYKARLQEKKKKWDAQHELKKKAAEQKKEAEEGE